MTIRELRQHWPAVEKALNTDEEILITRDGKPVARLLKFVDTAQIRPRFNSRRHLAEMRKILGNAPLPSVDERLAKNRKDRSFK